MYKRSKEWRVPVGNFRTALGFATDFTDTFQPVTVNTGEVACGSDHGFAISPIINRQTGDIGHKDVVMEQLRFGAHKFHKRLYGIDDVYGIGDASDRDGSVSVATGNDSDFTADDLLHFL